MRSLRIQLLGWRLLSLIALVLMVMAVFWHRQVTPPPVPQVVPPYAVPAVAKTVLTTADLPYRGGVGWLAVQSPLAPRRLAVPIRARASMLIDSVSFGGKLVMVTGRNYGPNDPNCCPSVPVHRTFACRNSVAVGALTCSRDSE